MTRHSSIALLWLLAFRGFTADFLEVQPVETEPHHLTPIYSANDQYDILLRQKLLVECGRCGGMLVRPSFAPEYAIMVHSQLQGEREHFYLTLTQAGTSIYFSIPSHRGGKSGRPRKVRVSRSDVEIPRELAVAVQRAWAAVLRQTRYPSAYPAGLDGETTQFFVFVRGLGLLEGETWSPQYGLPAAIRAAGSQLVEYCKASPEQRSLMLPPLQGALEQLERDAIKAEPDAPPNSRPPSPSPTSPEVQTSDPLRTPSPGGCG